MSLARRLMNGGIDGCTATVNESKYSADNGAMMIAMESAAELYEIAQEFYNYEQADISAIVEGVALEGSQYEPVAEAALKNAFDKVKAFIQKLWAKVKAFFKNVLVFLDTVFKSGKDFVKKYKDQISKLKDVNIEVSMWEYDNEEIDGAGSDEQIKEVETVMKSMEELVTLAGAATPDEFETMTSNLDNELNEGIYRDFTQGAATSQDELQKYFYNFFRGNKSTANLDRPKLTIKDADVKNMASVIEKSKGIDSIKKVQSKLDGIFKKSVADLSKLETKYNNEANKAAEGSDDKTTNSQMSKAAGQISKCVSKMSNISTTICNIAKAAMKERDTMYKMVISKAIRNGNKVK